VNLFAGIVARRLRMLTIFTGAHWVAQTTWPTFKPCAMLAIVEKPGGVANARDEPAS